MTFENKLSLVPLEDKQLHNVLDIGTGTGIWAIDFGVWDCFYVEETLLSIAAIRNPSAYVVGTDLSPIQPGL